MLPTSFVEESFSRRAFVCGSAGALTELLAPDQLLGAAGQRPRNPNLIGPIDGYSPQLGILVSMMDWMRGTVLRAVSGLSGDELDYLHDSESNSIGSLLLHLAATEAWYQVNTFERRDFTRAEERRWGAAQRLGAAAREEIKGHSLDYYLSTLAQVRERTLVEFRKRDDRWLAEAEPFFANQPTNNFAKWFHVCEHEANHRGQIAWLEKRLPGHEFADRVRG